MALLNLDKIVLNRTVMGPLCRVCGCELLETQQSPRANRARWWAFWRRVGSASIMYVCKGCGKRYWLTEKRDKALTP